jgi:hypothetical protein
MKFGLILVLLTILYFFYNEYQDAREEIKKELKTSAIATGDSFEKLNSRISKKVKSEGTQPIQLQDQLESKNKVILGLESSLSPSVGYDENMLEMLEEDPETTLKEMGHLLARNPHSVIWNNSLNLIKNAKINPDQKIDFLKAQLKSSGSLTDDENQNMRVLNQYKRITRTMKDIYITESRDLNELAEELGSISPPGELQQEVNSILYDENNN